MSYKVMSTVAITLLTHNRAQLTRRCLDISLNNAGRKWDEFIWVDNGSQYIDEIRSIVEPYAPTAQVLYKQNTGTQYGFNVCKALPRADYVVLLANDLIMPDGWLDTFMKYVETIPTGVCVMYDQPVANIHKHYPERFRAGKDKVVEVNGLPILRAMPMGTSCFRRAILPHVGYYREDFGVYGWGDVEWAFRCERILPTLGLEWYVIPDVLAVQLSSEGAGEYRTDVENGDSKEYWQWKQKECRREMNIKLMQQCEKTGWPFYSPF